MAQFDYYSRRYYLNEGGDFVCDGTLPGKNPYRGRRNLVPNGKVEKYEIKWLKQVTDKKPKMCGDRQEFAVTIYGNSTIPTECHIVHFANPLDVIEYAKRNVVVRGRGKNAFGEGIPAQGLVNIAWVAEDGERIDACIVKKISYVRWKEA